MLLVFFHVNLLCNDAIEGLKRFSFYRLEGKPILNHSVSPPYSEYHSQMTCGIIFVPAANANPFVINCLTCLFIVDFIRRFP